MVRIRLLRARRALRCFMEAAGLSFVDATLYALMQDETTHKPDAPLGLAGLGLALVVDERDCLRDAAGLREQRAQEHERSEAVRHSRSG